MTMAACSLSISLEMAAGSRASPTSRRWRGLPFGPRSQRSPGLVTAGRSRRTSGKLSSGLFLLRGRVENEFDFWNLEARDFDVEADSDEMLQLDLENLLIPASF